MKQIALIGVNYAASLIMDILTESDEDFAFTFFDDDISKHEKRFFEIRVRGNTEKFFSIKHEYDAAVICIGEKHLSTKLKIGERLNAESVHSLAVKSIHSISSRTAVVEAGSVISSGVYLGQRTHVGVHSMVWANTTLEHDVKLGNACYVGPGAVLSGCVQVGHCTLIGSNATILPEVKIGNHCKIGAGAVVTKDVSDGTTVVGVPAKNISL